MPLVAPLPTLPARSHPANDDQWRGRERRPTQPDELSRYVWSPGRVLEHYGVPSLHYDTLGFLVEVSDTATELLADRKDEVIRQANRLAAALLEVAPLHGDGARRAQRTEPGSDGATTLRAQLLPDIDGTWSVIVLLLPAARRTSTSTHLGWGLTARETTIAHQIATGASTKEIAARLSISAHTTRRHTERVFSKLGVRSRAQVVRIIAGLDGARAGDVA